MMNLNTSTAHDSNEKLVEPTGDVNLGDRLVYVINDENEGEILSIGI